jgi:hypothetical protein
MTAAAHVMRFRDGVAAFVAPETFRAYPRSYQRLALCF